MPIVPVAGGPRAQLGVTPNARLALPDSTVPDARMSLPTMGTPQISTPRIQAKTMRPELRDPGAIRRVELTDGGARQMIQAGNNLAPMANALERAAMDMQVKVNATVVDDALNDVREAARKLTWGEKTPEGGLAGGYRNAKGYDAIKRASGKALDDEVGEEFDTAIKDIAKTKLTSQDQRTAYEAQVSSLASQLRQGAAIHQAEQFDSYHSSVYKGMVSNLTQDFARRDPTDLAGQKEAMTQIEGAVATLAAHQGASAQELDVGQRAARGAAIGSLFEVMVSEKKYDVAQALLNEWGPKIDANTAVKMKLGLDGRVGIQLGEQIAESAWRNVAAPAFETGDAGRAYNVVLGTEARGAPRHLAANGKLLVSPKGAYGVGQLMPDTAEAMAKKLGRPDLVELSKQTTKEGEAANRLLGETYFKTLVTRFKGDLPKAIAAYNAGPGWLVGGKDTKGNKIEGALNIAARTGTDWREHLPKETRDYLTYAMKSFGQGQGTPAMPTRQSMLDAIDARTTDPDVRRAAYSWADRRWAAADADKRNREESAFTTALGIVRETGGDLNAVSPELRAAIPADKFDTVQTYAKNMTEGGYIATKPEAYYVAMISAKQPGTTLNQIEAMRPDLNEQDFAAVRKEFMDARSPQPGKGPDSLDTSTLDSLVDTRLQYLGIDTKPKKGDTAAMARLGAIRQFTHQYVLDQQRTSGGKFTDYKQIQDVVNQLFTRGDVVEKTMLGMRTGQDEVLPVLSTELNKLPTATVKRVTDQLQKHMGRKPTEAEVYQAYWRSKFYSGAN